jgi:hypothetical protein
MNDIPGMNDHIGGRIECVYVGNGEYEIPYSLIRVGCIQGNMGIGDLRVIMMPDPRAFSGKVDTGSP